MPINRTFQRLKKPRKDGFHAVLNTIYSGCINTQLLYIVHNKGDDTTYMKFYERLEHWSYLLKSKALYHELKYYVKKRQTHIKQLYGFNSRGIGKTYNLMKISGKYKIPVIEPMGSMADYAYKMHLKFNPIVLTPSQLKGRVQPGTIILVDEKQLLNENAKSELDRYIQVGFETEN